MAQNHIRGQRGRKCLAVTAMLVGLAGAGATPAAALDASVGRYRLGDPQSLEALVRQGAELQNIGGDCWTLIALSATGDQQLSFAASGERPPESLTEYRLSRPSFDDSLLGAPVLSVSAFVTELGLSLGMSQDDVLSILGLPADQFGDDSGTEWYSYDASALGLDLIIPGLEGPPPALYGFQAGELVDVTVGSACTAP